MEARRNLGTVLERQGLSDARTCYQAILAREPADPLLRLRVDSLCPAIPVGNPEIDKYRAGLMARLGQLCAQPGLWLIRGSCTPVVLNLLYIWFIRVATTDR